MISDTDNRTRSMLDWLNDDLALSLTHHEPASSDASFRRYFRVYRERETYIVMDAPPDKEDTEPFIKVAGLLSKAGIHVPAIFASDLERGFLLLEDFGSSPYLDRLDAASAERLYSAALDSLRRQQIGIDSAELDLPDYDRALLTRELTVFDEWFVGRYLDASLPSGLRTELDHLLIDSALEQPRVFVHRDYHSRNLMDLPAGGPGVIDFQDAVIGPVTYDLVSLLRDCYIAWPEDRINDWAGRYHRLLREHGLVDCDWRQFQRWFDLMGLQRHLKAIGIFSRLHLRDGKSAYLNDIPRTMRYVVSVCARYPELSGFSSFLHDELLPLYRRRR